MDRFLTINELLKDTITKIDYTLTPPGFENGRFSFVQQRISQLIDAIGKESAQSQRLGRVITSGDKLRTSPTHTLYLLKDPYANGGTGALIGLLKVAKKDLYLHHPHGGLVQSSPWCILDFHIVNTYQRKGHGKKIFDHMLTDINTEAHQLAIDYPSLKMEQFLRKNYGFKNLVRQSNNFAVPSEFFGVISESSDNKATPPSVGRFAAPKPASEIANVIHGSTPGDSNTPSRAATPDKEKENEYKATPTAEIRNLIFVEEPNSTVVETQVTTKEPISAEGEIDVQDQANLQKSPERPSTLGVEPVSAIHVSDLSPAGSTISRRDSQLTDRGYFDVKFYHNKLW